MEQQYNNNNDDVDLENLLKLISDFFRKLLKLALQVIVFYKKKVLLFLTLIIIGIILGYFYDYHSNVNKRYQQQIILEPKYNSTQYLYEFTNNLNSNIKDIDYLKSIQLNPEWITNVVSINLEPIEVLQDVIDQMYAKYEKQNFEGVVDNFNSEDVDNDKYRNFYRYHQLTIEFNNKNQYNNRVSEAILDFVNSNKYFQNYLSLSKKQATRELTENQESLLFIDQYLSKLSDNKVKSNGEIIVIADEAKTTTIASLLKQKDLLLEEIRRINEILIINTAVLIKVNDTGIIKSRVRLRKRAIILLPLLLIVLGSVFYLLQYLYRQTVIFVNNN